MNNPNNCATCDYKCIEGDGWCYMFRDEPKERCMQHTGRKVGLDIPIWLLKRQRDLPLDEHDGGATS